MENPEGRSSITSPSDDAVSVFVRSWLIISDKSSPVGTWGLKSGPKLINVARISLSSWLELIFLFEREKEQVSQREGKYLVCKHKQPQCPSQVELECMKPWQHQRFAPRTGSEGEYERIIHELSLCLDSDSLSCNLQISTCRSSHSDDPEVILIGCLSHDRVVKLTVR